MQASNSTCSSNIKQAAQQLLTGFAAPIIAQEMNASAAAGKYEVASYAVSQDTYLYDHAKVSGLMLCCDLGLPDEFSCIC